jgi:hypothetical protein
MIAFVINCNIEIAINLDPAQDGITTGALEPALKHQTRNSWFAAVAISLYAVVK